MGVFSGITSLDEAILRAAHGGPAWLVSIFFALTVLGAGWGALTLLPFLLRQRTRKTALFFAATLALSGIAANVIKLCVARPRPCATLSWCTALGGAPPTSSSFPSGHAAGAFAFAAFLAAQRPRFAAPLFTLAALVAWSRCVLGVHYPSDIVFGALLGAAIGLAGARVAAGRGAPSAAGGLDPAPGRPSDSFEKA